MENIIQILTGFTVAILAGLAYSIIPQGFLSGGRFRNKPEAVIIVLVTAFLLGILTPTISNLWNSVLPKLNYIQIIGLLILFGTFTVNEMVKNWKHTTKTSVVLYLAGIILLVIPHITQ